MLKAHTRLLIRVSSRVREILSHVMDIFVHLTHHSFKINYLPVKI